MTDFFAPAPEPKTELGRYQLLSPLAGVRVSPLQLGAMSIGDAWGKVMGTMDKEQSFKLLDAYFEAGGNFIDTANNYQDDQSETWIGEWMAERGNRDRLVIATKFTSNYKSYSLGKGASVQYSGNHKKSLHISVRDSLKKLQTDYIDILYLHWWDWTTSIEEVMDSLHALVLSGKVLYLGISDTPAWIVSAANTYAKFHGKSQFVIYQGRWNVMLRDLEREIIPMTRQFGMAIAPWDAIGGGRFQSIKSMEARKAAGENIRTMMGGPEQSKQEIEISEALSKVAAEHGIESVTAIALAYVMAKTPYVFPIVGGRKVEHLHDNVQALKIKLTKKQIGFLESHTSFSLGFPGDFVGSDPKWTGESQMILGATAPFTWVTGGKPYTAE